MSSTDIIGWTSLAAFGLGFAALYWFITQPSRRLEKLLGDGVRFGLRKLNSKGTEMNSLKQRLEPFFGEAGTALKLGSVYQRVGASSYLISVSEQTRHGTKTTYRHTEKYVYLGSTGLATPFGVMPKPPDSPLSRIGLGMLRQVGMEIREETPELLPEFRDLFLVHGAGAASRDLRIPRGVQEVVLRASRNTQAFDLTKALAGAEGMSFLPEGFVIHLSATAELKNVDQIRGLLEMAEGIETGLRLG